MAYSEMTLWCDGCGREILWIPYVVHKKEFCCQDCAFGFTCQCGESIEWEEDYRDTVTTIPITHFGN